MSRALDLTRHEAESVLSLLAYARRVLPEGASSDRVLGLVEGFARAVCDASRERDPIRVNWPKNAPPGPPLDE